MKPGPERGGTRVDPRVRSSLRFALAVVVAAGGYGFEGRAQCTDLVLMAQKDLSGNDVELSWSGGCCAGGGCSVEYDLYSSISPKMTSFPSHLLGDPVPSPLTSFVDVGAGADGRGLVCYVVSDQTKTDLQVTSPLPGFNTSSPTIAVSGTHVGGVTDVWVNEQLADLGASTFDVLDPPGVPLALGVNTIYASARQSALPYANLALVFGPAGSLAGNPPPSIEFPDPGDGSTIRDDTPTLKVWFCDLDGRATIDTASKFLQLDGLDVTTLFGNQANVTCASGHEGIEFSYTPSTPLADGTHFLAATVADTAGYTTNGSAAFELDPPLITNLTPGQGTVTTTVTIDGAGFDPGGTNIVRFGSTVASIEPTPPMTDTQITTKVPTGAVGGPVTVEVNGRVSNEFPFKVLLGTGFSAITSVAINDAMADASRTPILFAAAATSDEVWQVMMDGTYEGKLINNNDPVGLPVDSLGNTYFGSSFTGSNNGPVGRVAPPPPGSFGSIVMNTRLLGETESRIDGCGAPSPSGPGDRLYLLDGANGKIKRIDEDGSGGLSTSRVGTGVYTFVRSNGIIKSQSGTELYFTDQSFLKSIPVGGGTTTTLFSGGGPTGMANSLTPEGWVVVAHRGLAGGRRVSVIDPTSCSPGPCVVYVLAIPGQRLYDVDFGTDADGPYVVVVAEESEVYRVGEPTISLSAFDGSSTYPIPDRVDADFDPIAGAVQPGTQFLVLQASLNPAALIPDGAPPPFPAEVEWMVEDVDDPSDDPQIDPNGPAGDDNVVALGFNPYAPLWEEWGSYTMGGGSPSNSTTVTTAILGGKSQVQLNLAGRPGENYRVTARVTVPIYGDLEAESNVFTVWKVLYLELDSMGPCQGPFGADDVPCTDVPQPDVGNPSFEYFVDAFRPAYVDVRDAGQPSPNVRFQYHVEDATQTQLLVQGTLGREPPISSRGYWELVLQNAYDGPIGKDNDPDIEDARTGATYIIPGVNSASLNFSETIRDDAVEKSKDLVYAQRYVELHEAVHQFAADDQSGGVMEYFGDPYLTSCQIKIIRRCIEFPSELNFIPASQTCTITCP